MSDTDWLTIKLNKRLIQAIAESQASDLSPFGAREGYATFLQIRKDFISGRRILMFNIKCDFFLN